HGQYIAEILYTLKIKQYAIENNKSACPKNNTKRAVHEKTRPIAFPIVWPQTVDCGEYARS
ncbi:MAG: hypothetical protein COS89_09260, partial [Deltaproteobacteria bacterium CG07_land_8_20_14_0_80_38_7]